MLSAALAPAMAQEERRLLAEESAAPAVDGAAPTGILVAAIRFAGNRTTRPKVMLRELPFQVGDRIAPAQIEQGRQAILDLGLFRSVRVEQTAGESGSVLTYTVDEKFYILPLPRVDANGDGQYAYGGQLSWDNVWGLNHRLSFTGLLRDQQREGIGKETNYFFGYGAPFVFDSRWSVALGGSTTERPVESRFGPYEERFQSLQAFASRALSDGPPSQGWTLGAGLLWQNQDTRGPVEPYGEATAPALTLGYRDLRFKQYSEEGLVWGSRLELAQKGLGSDYDYTRFSVGGIRYTPFGKTPHQTLHLIGELGLNWAGPPGVRNYSLGGSFALRGYDSNFLEGDAYYRVAVEWARPVGWRWLRVVVIAEAGSVAEQPGQLLGNRVYSSIGLGIRVRLPAFVNSQFEAGIALPLSEGPLHPFGGRV